MEEEPVFRAWVATQLRNHATQIAEAWLQALQATHDESPYRIFPSEALLNHIPDLVSKVADSVASPDVSLVTEDELIRRDLMDLARLRRHQGYDLQELLSEFDKLKEIVFEHLQAWAKAEPGDFSMSSALEAYEVVRRNIDRVASVTHAAFHDSLQSELSEGMDLIAGFGQKVNHELRNRLNSATLLVASAKLGKAESLTALEAALQGAARVVDDVYAVAVMHHGKGATAGHGRIPLDEAVRQIVHDIAPYAESRNVSIEIADGLPTFQCDWTRVQLTLVNLLNNAIKYGQQNNGLIRISAFELGDGAWQIDVRDNGPGIDQELQHSIFEPNVRANDSEPGDGLGLAIARRAIEQLGGRIWVQSIEGQGCVFSFTLSEPATRLDRPTS